MAQLDDQSWQKVEALLRELPCYQIVSTSARDDIERICAKLLQSRSFYTTRAPDHRKEIADLKKASELADTLREHLLAMIQARNGRFMAMEIHEDPDFFDPVDGFFCAIHRYPDQIREVQPLTGENYIGLLEAFSRNCEWVRRRLQEDVWEYGVTAAGPRALHDEKHAFADFMAIWRKAGGPSLITIQG